MEDVSSIDSLLENDINNADEEDDKKMLSILSEMKFNEPFEKYIINHINSIIKENSKKITPLFKEKEYSLKEIIEEFEQYYPYIITKEKNKMNKSLDVKHKNESKILDIHQPEINVENNSIINISVDNNKKDCEFSFDSLNSVKIFDKFLKDTKVNHKKTELNIISKDENTNVKLTEFKCHALFLLVQLLKCFEREENSFEICHIGYKLVNISKDIKDLEFDFIINNIDSTLFFELIKYLEKNILILKFKGNRYDIIISNNFDKILSDLKNVKKFDIMGEVGLDDINDENKTKKFINYSKFLNYLDKNKNNDDNEINLFYEKTGFLKENEKILFFIIDFNFNESNQYLSEGKLYKAMKESKENINFVLFNLSSDLNEKIILKKEDKEIKEKKDYKTLLDNIKLSNENYFLSEKFKISCNKLNSLLVGIDKIKAKFNKKNTENIQIIFDTFEYIIMEKSIKINKDLKMYFKTLNTPIKVYDKKYSIEDEFVVLYIKNILIFKDKMFEALNNMKIKFTTIYLNKEDTILNKIKKLKNSHNLYKIYFFIGNCFTSDEKKIEKFIYDLILNLKITKAHYIFLYNPKYSGKIESYQHTLEFNINISKNENQFIEQYKNTKKKIYSYYNDLQKIIREKKYYDLFIKIYIQKYKTYIMNSSKSDEKDLLKKINEVFYFMSNLEFITNIPEVIQESSFEELIKFIDEKIKIFIDAEINSKIINKIFKDIKDSFMKEKNYLGIIQNKIKSFCFNYLKRSILDNIYRNFIDIFIPMLSFQAFNEKIEAFLAKKENQISLTEEI